jgi:hypothetical protein
MTQLSSAPTALCRGFDARRVPPRSQGQSQRHMVGAFPFQPQQRGGGRGGRRGGRA